MSEAGNPRPVLPDSLLPEDPGYYYSSLLPFRQKEGPGGQTTPGQGLEWAVPGAIRQLVNQAYTAAVLPGNALVGKYSSADLARLAPQAAMGLMGAGSLTTTGEEAGGTTLGMMIGQGAKKVNTRAGEYAAQLEAAGKDMDTIRNQTGWFRDPVDRKWKTEISDDASRFGLRLTDEDFDRGHDITLSDLAQRAAAGETVPMGNVLDHPALYEQYPWARDIPTLLGKPHPDYGGFYDPGTGTVSLNESSFDDQHSVALHEVQHAIQHFEGFGAGASVAQFLPKDFQAQFAKAKTTLDNAHGALLDRGLDPGRVSTVVSKTMRGEPLTSDDNQIVSQMRNYPNEVQNFILAQHDYIPMQQKYSNAVGAYRNTSGEVEARNVQSRQNLTPTQRMSVAPWSNMSQDVPYEQQTFMPWSNPSPYRPRTLGDAMPQPKGFGKRTGGPSAAPTDMGGDLGSGAEALPPGASAGPKGWHGTPHTFEPVEGNPFGEFRDSAIGSGEGAQVYGFGHYVAGAEGTARVYRAGLSQQAHGDPTAGSLYRVAIRPDESEMLDWDKPVTEGNVLQKTEHLIGSDTKPSDILRDLKEASIGNLNLSSMDVPPEGEGWNAVTGAHLYDYLTTKLGSQDAASKALHEAGVPGIKYLDQFSRDYNPDHGGVEYEGKNLTGSGRSSQLRWSDIAGQVADPSRQENFYNIDSAFGMLHQHGSVDAALHAADQMTRNYDSMAKAGGSPINPADVYTRAASDSRETAQWIRDNRSKLSFAPPKPPTSNYVVFHPKNLKIVGRNGQEVAGLEHPEFDPWEPNKILQEPFK